MDPYIDIHTHKSNAVEGVITPRSFGIHPWSIVSDLSPVVAQTFPQDIQMIGECGLDKCRGGAWELQQSVFLQQLQLAENLRKPVVVHCVRAFNELLQLRKSRSWRQPWIFHGFRGNPQQALQCHRLGIICSFGDALCQPQGSKSREALKALGIQDRTSRFFLETDQSATPIQTLYAEAASVLHIEATLLKEAIFNAYRALFNR